MLRRLSRALRAYRRDERAGLTVEAVIVLPVLFWAFAAMFVFFDNFRAHSIAQKAAFTIGDMISRETEYVTNAYLDGAQSLLQFLSESAPGDTSLRITVIRYDAEEEAYGRVWSQVRGSAFQVLSGVDVSNLADDLPVMVDNEQLILVETNTRVRQIGNVGLLNDRVETFVFTRPRFAPQVLWSDTL
ncbi:TadE/TadG family type IV pilus assembly protein [Pseudaestuariivita sp.]|uniref:TadE/TadG family type IV pilus assembly protein n=1 Tax=Pseudaestuariivita sp. TaxID=2211669 RepID=UPI00405A2A63